MKALSKINYKIIFHIMGLLFVVNGIFMVLSVGVSFFYEDETFIKMILAGITAIGLGGIIMVTTRKHRKEIQMREGYIIVTFGWLVMALIGTLPYVFTESIPAFTNAFFESMSGYTATGATIIEDVESLPKGILFWRSITHWIGGMGIIVLAVAILPLLGIGGMQLFAAEVPGPSGDKLHPRIKDTAKRLWLIYVGYTAAETVLLKVAGMSFFDALNHSMSTLSTGGFSTKNDSIAFWNDKPIIHYIIIGFMFFGSTNLVLSYLALKGRFRRVFEDEEFRTYIGILLSFTVIISLVICFSEYIYWEGDFFKSAENVFRHALFQVLSIISTTGFISADYTTWSPFVLVLFFGMMFIGGCAGSTSGGIKIMRHLIMIKNGVMEFKRTLHPNAILPVRYNNKAVPRPIVYNVLGFFTLYVISFSVGVLVFSWLGLDFMSALGGAAATVGNVGPAIGDLGPSNTYAFLSDAAKWWSSFLMLIGRLELFTVLIILTPFFWRSR